VKILQVVSSLDRLGGGLSKTVSDLGPHLAKLNTILWIYTNLSSNPYLKEDPLSNLNLRFVDKQSFKRNLKTVSCKENFDVMHGHGIWQMPVYHMAQLAHKKDIPYIISPHGSLEPWALHYKKWKKLLALELYQERNLSLAACIHATAQSEAENLFRFGLKGPIAVIPNGIDLFEFSLPRRKTLKQKKTVLFLSRIHPKKGIEILIEAWGSLDKAMRKNWDVKIVGFGEAKYIQSLVNRILNKGLAGEITIVDSQFGSERLKFFDDADLFVLPTHSENFGLVIAEALASHIPVITTKGTPWQDLEKYSCGWWIDIGVEPLKTALIEAMLTNDDKLIEMGQNGYKLIAEKYSIDDVALKMKQLYEWLSNAGSVPDFIRYK
jgi:glycosyltransferase involved in cell wall biosynthesis